MTPDDPFSMKQFALLKYARERGVDLPKDTPRAEILKALGIEKKGKRSWKPAQKLSVNVTQDVTNKFRLRWRDKDPQNLQRAEAEGWEYIHSTKGAKAEHENPGDSNPLTSTTEYRELVLMGLPKDLAEARDEYYAERTREQTEGLKGRFQKDLDDAARQKGGYRTSVTGKIVID
jgi:hypothetical protein